MKIESFEVFQVELPFRAAFRHALQARRTSSSVFVRCQLGSGAVGFGECLPRPYVTGETAPQVFDLLVTSVLPFLFDCDFNDYGEVESFCASLYPLLGRRLASLPPHYGATCCAAELALLDAYGRHFGRSIMEEGGEALRYSGVISSVSPVGVLALAFRYRLARLPAIKLKVGSGWDMPNARICRAVFGRDASLRVDANGAWSMEQATEIIPRLNKLNINYVEQPLARGDFKNMRQLHERTGASLIADEDLRDLADAGQLIESNACQVFNIRVSKLGGFFESLKIVNLARKHGIEVQVGCQVGETALLSTAGLALARRLKNPIFLEGFFGTYLLQQDILSTSPETAEWPHELHFARGGLPPRLPPQDGIGVSVDQAVIERYAIRKSGVLRNHRAGHRFATTQSTSRV